MSSYHAVVPVSWSKLTDVVVPAWVDTLLGKRTIASFHDELAPDEEGNLLEAWEYGQGRPWWSEARAVAAQYIADIGWHAGMPWVAADRVRACALHEVIRRSCVAEVGVHAIHNAVRCVASVDLAGEDPFENYSLPYERLYIPSFFQYYGRLDRAPHPQVAGTKNQYHFLNRLFVHTYRAERHVYDCVAHAFVAPELRALLEALFLSTRAFPGTWVTDRDSTWQASDDHWLPGALAPDEVKRLVPYLDDLARLEAALPLDKQDVLLPVFADRVRRSAEQGLGLVTLFAGL